MPTAVYRRSLYWSSRLASTIAAVAAVVLLVASWSATAAHANLTPPPGKPPAGWVSTLTDTPAPPGVDYSADGDAGLQLVPGPSTPFAPGGVHTNNVVSTRMCSISAGTLPQNQRFATIRDIPGSLVVGNCRGGSIAYQQIQDGAATWGFDCVSSFNNCGWLLYSNSPLQNNNSNNHCLNSPTSPAISSFAFYSNCPPHTCSDGSPIHLRGNCAAYANVNPEIPHSAPTDQSWTRGGGQTMLWRYVTADNLYVLARDPLVSIGDGNWIFIPGVCFDSAELTTGNPYQITYYRGSPA